MIRGDSIRLSLAEARALMLAAQGLSGPRPEQVDEATLLAMIERLGVVQIDTINVLERSQYLVLWSRLGPFAHGTEGSLLDRLLYPGRQIMEYWAHAASILPMRDYPYHRLWMQHHAQHMWRGNREWMAANPLAMQETLQAVRERGPVASADFERIPGAPRTGPWDWHGPKPSRHALEILWTSGELMVHSRRGGQKVYDLRDRVLAEAFGAAVPADDELPTPEERRRYLARRTSEALGVIVPSWLWDYFRLSPPAGAKKQAGALALLEEFAREGALLPAMIEGIDEPAFLVPALLPALERVRAGERAARTTLLTPFDSLIWDRARAESLFGYQVCFEAYVPQSRRRYGYYCLAILHGDRLVGRLDPKLDRARGQLQARTLHLEPGVAIDEALLDGLACALRELARFLGATTVSVGSSDPPLLADALRERVGG